MILISLTLALAVTSAWLWWRVTRAQQNNEALQAEIDRLRRSARRLRD